MDEGTFIYTVFSFSVFHFNNNGNFLYTVFRKIVKKREPKTKKILALEIAPKSQISYDILRNLEGKQFKN